MHAVPLQRPEANQMRKRLVEPATGEMAEFATTRADYIKALRAASSSDHKADAGTDAVFSQNSLLSMPLDQRVRAILRSGMPAVHCLACLLAVCSRPGLSAFECQANAVMCSPSHITVEVVKTHTVAELCGATEEDVLPILQDLAVLVHGNWVVKRCVSVCACCGCIGSLLDLLQRRAHVPRVRRLPSSARSCLPVSHVT